MDAESIFDKFAEEIDASVNEFNALRGSRGLHCERTPTRVAVHKELPPRITVELEFDKASGTVRMRRQRLEHLITDLRYMIDRRTQVDLGRADYSRLARQALRPLMDAFE